MPLSLPTKRTFAYTIRREHFGLPSDTPKIGRRRVAGAPRHKVSTTLLSTPRLNYRWLHNGADGRRRSRGLQQITGGARWRIRGSMGLAISPSATLRRDSRHMI